jgi:hypothetical protein
VIPGFVKRLIRTSLLVALVLFLFLLAKDWRLAVGFGLATLWMTGNVLIWTVIAYVLTRRQTGFRRAKLLGLVTGKLAFLALGVVGLTLAAPMSPRQMLAILAGITLTFFVVVLKAAGAWLTGTDLLTGRRIEPPPEEQKKQE